MEKGTKGRFQERQGRSFQSLPIGVIWTLPTMTVITCTKYCQSGKIDLLRPDLFHPGAGEDCSSCRPCHLPVPLAHLSLALGGPSPSLTCLIRSLFHMASEMAYWILPNLPNWTFDTSHFKNGTVDSAAEMLLRVGAVSNSSLSTRCHVVGALSVFVELVNKWVNE